MKKILAILLALAMVLSLAACGASQTEEPATEAPKADAPVAEAPAEEEHEPVTIEFLCWGAAETTTSAAFTAMIEGFEAKYPWITVEVTECNYDAVNTTLLTRAASQSAPDVAQVSNQWVAALYEMDALTALDDIMDPESLADYYPGAKAGTTIGGKVYSAPWIMQPMTMYCNLDLIKAAGYEGVPTTWDEYIEQCYAIAALGTNADGNTVYGRSLASTVLVGAGYFSLIDVWSNGGEFSDADGNICFYSEGTVAAYTELQNMVKENVIAPGLQIVDNRSLFGNGQVGFHFDAPSQVANFSNVNLEVAQVPGGCTFSSDHHLVAFQNSEHPAECALLIDYLSGPEGMDLYTDHNDVICARYSVEELDFFQNMSGNMSVFFGAAGIAKSLPVQSSNFPAAMEAIAEGIQRVVIGMEDVDTVIKDVDAELQEMYK